MPTGGAGGGSGGGMPAQFRGNPTLEKMHREGRATASSTSIKAYSDTAKAASARGHVTDTERATRIATRGIPDFGRTQYGRFTRAGSGVSRASDY